jgi:hypothetical protein
MVPQHFAVLQVKFGTQKGPSPPPAHPSVFWPFKQNKNQNKLLLLMLMLLVVSCLFVFILALSMLACL